MLAVTAPTPGGPDSLILGEVPEPQVTEGDVLIDVVASGVNRADLLQRAGHYPPPPGESSILGLECSGRVVSVGDAVQQWNSGDEVCALLTGGGYAERVVVPSCQVMPVPHGVSLVEAAALPEVTCTVWSNLVMVGGLRRGESVLIHGGGSGVGTMAIQVAKQLGATVLVTCGSGRKVAACLDLGAHHAINYRELDFVDEVRRLTQGRGVDLVLDIVGAKYLRSNLRSLATGGRLVVIGLQGGTTGEIDLGRLLARRASVHGTTLRSRPAAEKCEIVKATVNELWPAISEGRIRPVIDRVIPWRSVSDAHRALENGDVIGKIVLEVRNQEAG